MEINDIVAINFENSTVNLGYLNEPIDIDDALSGECDFENEYPYISQISLDIIGYDEEYDGIKIGSIEGRYVDINEMILQEEHIGGYLDNEEPDLCEFYYIAENERYIGHRNNIFAIDSIKLEENFKDDKLLSVAIILLEQYIKISLRKEIGVFVVANKSSWHTDNEESSSLAFWRKLGFRDSGFQDIMYFNTDFDMREIYNLDVIEDYSYRNTNILAFPNHISIFTYYNNKKFDGLKLNFDMVSKEELFMMFAEGRKDSDIAKLFGTTAAKVKSVRAKYYITEEDLQDKPDELVETIINCMKKFNY